MHRKKQLYIYYVFIIKNDDDIKSQSGYKRTKPSLIWKNIGLSKLKQVLVS